MRKLALLCLLAGSPLYAQNSVLNIGAGPNTTLGTGVLSNTYTAGAGGVTANELVSFVSGLPALPTTATGYGGIALTTAAAGASVEIARFGVASCVFDGPTTIGDYAIPSSTTLGECSDSTATSPASVSDTTPIIGIIQSVAAQAGQTAAIRLHAPGSYGQEMLVNVQTGNYTPTTSDRGKFVHQPCTAACVLTLPAPSSVGPMGFWFNPTGGAFVPTVTVTSGTINGQSAIYGNIGASYIYTDGVNWFGSGWSTISARVVNGVGYSFMYPYSDLSARVNACVVDAETRANGVFSGKCSSLGEPYLGTLHATLKIGDSNSDYVEWEHPAFAQWSAYSTTYWGGTTAGTLNILDQYDGSIIDGASPVGGFKIINTVPPADGQIYTVYMSHLGISTGGSYVILKNIYFESAAVSAGGTITPASHSVGIETFETDSTLFENVLVVANDPVSGTPLSGVTKGDWEIGGGTTFPDNQCCSAAHDRLQINSNYTGGLGLHITSSNTIGGANGISFKDLSVGHPAAGYPMIQCDDVSTQHNTVVHIFDLYEEGPNNDTTTPHNIDNGCGMIDITGEEIKGEAGNSSTAVMWQVNANGTGSYSNQVHLVIHGHSTPFGSAFPAMLVQNTITGTPLLTDAYGFYNDYEGGGTETIDTPDPGASTGALNIFAPAHTAGTGATNWGTLNVGTPAAFATLTHLAAGGTGIVVAEPSSFSGDLFSAFVNNGSTSQYHLTAAGNTTQVGYQVAKYNLPYVGAAVASATTIAPTGTLFHLTGTATVSTISALTGTSNTGNTPLVGASIFFISDGASATATGGNISNAVTFTAGCLNNALWDGTAWTVNAPNCTGSGATLPASGVTAGTYGSTSVTSGTSPTVPYFTVGSTGVLTSAGSITLGTAATYPTGTSGSTLCLIGTTCVWGKMQGATISTIASAAAVAPTTAMVIITGTTAMSSMTPPSGVQSNGGCFDILATGAWSTTTGGSPYPFLNAITVANNTQHRACYWPGSTAWTIN